MHEAPNGLGERVTNNAVTHDVVLARGDGCERRFRIYGRPVPEKGDVVTLPVDGQFLSARVVVCSASPKTPQSPDVKAIELVE